MTDFKTNFFSIPAELVALIAVCVLSIGYVAYLAWQHFIKRCDRIGLPTARHRRRKP